MNQHFYDQVMYQFAASPATYWHRNTPRVDLPTLATACEADVAIIGGGFTGLSAALHLVRDHGVSVVLLEAGELSWGASSRNAGFNTLAATKLGIADIHARWGKAAGSDFFASQLEGQQMANALAESEQFEIEGCGDGTFMVAHSPKAWTSLKAEAREWQSLTPIPVRVLDADEFAAVGHGGAEQFGALHFQSGGGINPLAYATGLAKAALRHGARLFSHSPVLRWDKQDAMHRLHTPHGSVLTRTVIVATNAYPLPEQPSALHRRLLPAISNILVTVPLSDAQWAEYGFQSLNPMFDARHLLNYYRRLPDNRFLFGARGDLTGSADQAADMQRALQFALVRKFPHWGNVPIEYFWRGLVSVTRKMVPSIGVLPGDNSVWYGFGCYGNGVNTMPWIGRTLARHIAGVPLSRLERCPVYQGLPDRLPPGHWLQKLGLRLAYAKYAGLDALA